MDRQNAKNDSIFGGARTRLPPTERSASTHPRIALSFSSLSAFLLNIGNFPANAKVPLPRERRSLVRKFPGKSLNQAEYDGIPSINVYSETPSEVPEKYRYAGKCEG